jgi:hypothetical protein
MSAAGSFAALAIVFGSPVIGAVILIEAAELGGATLPVVLLPGLLAAGIGSLVYLGLGYLTGLDASAYAIKPLALPPMPQLTVVDFCWTLAVATLAAAVTFAIVERRSRDHAADHRGHGGLVPPRRNAQDRLRATSAQDPGE